MVLRGLLMLMLVVPGLGAASAQGTWSAAVPVTAVNSPVDEFSPQISADMRKLRLVSARTDIPGRISGLDIYYATRLGPGSPWSTLRVEPGVINTIGIDFGMHVLSDELTAYTLMRIGWSSMDVWRVTRSTPGVPWASSTLVSTVNSPAIEQGVSVTDDDLYMLLWSYWGNFVESVRSSTSSPWAAPVPVRELNSVGVVPLTGSQTRVTPDGLTVYLPLFWAPGYKGYEDICVSTRAFRTDKWSTPAVIPGAVNTARFGEIMPSVSADGRELYFVSTRLPYGGHDVFVSYFTGLSYQNLPRIGSPLLLHVTHRQRPGALYQIGLSLTNTTGIAVPGVGVIPLDPDPLLQAVVYGTIPGLTSQFSGRLDANGMATGQLNIPPVPRLVGVAFHAAAVLFGPGGITYISNGRRLGIHR